MTDADDEQTLDVPPLDDQAVEHFFQHAAETFDRVDRTGQPETISVGGQPRAVLLSPAAYAALVKEYWLAHDAEMILQSERDIAAGNFVEASVFFAELEAELQAMLATQAAEQPVGSAAQ